MLNLNEVSGVKSSPISKSILENSLGTTNLKDSRAYSNYEFLLDRLTKGAFSAPSVILASGTGAFYPKAAAYQNNFYSSIVLGRDGYLNSWQTSYSTDEGYEITYYDGSTIFKEFKIDPGTGRIKTKSAELRNGNLPGQAGFAQLIFGYNGDASVNDIGYYRHNFRTRHSETDNNQNAIDIFLWDKVNDSKTALGSRRVFSLYGTGNVEIVSGTEIFGPVNIDISTGPGRITETSTLAVPGKGVIYYNQTTNKYRYSENGGPFKDIGSGDSEIYYTTFADKVFDRVYDTGSSSVVTAADFFVLHAGFEVDDTWSDGEMKEFHIRGIVNPIKVNPSRYDISSIVNLAVGNVIFEIEDSHYCYFHSISSYLDQHIVSLPSILRKSRSAYNIKVELVRNGTDLKFVAVEYRIPFYYEDDVNHVYNEGELTFRALTRESNNNLYPFTSGQIFDGSIKKVNITIGTDWTINGCLDDCANWLGLFQPSTDEMYLSIKTLEP